MALFPIAMEFDVLLPEVAAADVLQLVSCFSLDGVVVCAAAGLATNNPARTADPTRTSAMTR
jgi:hypothetical protein